MQYGNLGLNADRLSLYMGSNPVNDNATFVDDNSLPSFSRSVNQREADLVYYWQKVSFLALDLYGRGTSSKHTLMNI